LDDAYLASLNPHVFDAVIRAVDLGIPTDTNRIRDFVTTALDTASLPAKRIEVPIAIAAGRAKLGPFSAQAHDAEREATANVSLAEATLDSLLTLAGTPPSSGAVRPMIFISLRGPLSAPSRTLDTN